MLFYARPLEEEHRTDLWKLIKEQRLPIERKGKFEHERFVPTHPYYNEKFSFLDEL